MYATDTDRKASGSAAIASEAVASVWALAPPHFVRGWCHHVPQCATVAYNIYTEPGNDFEEQQGSGSMPDGQYKQNDYGDETTPQKEVEQKQMDYSFDEDKLQEEPPTPVISSATGPAIPASFRSAAEYEPEPRLADECMFVAPVLGGQLHIDVNSQHRESRANSVCRAKGCPTPACWHRPRQIEDEQATRFAWRRVHVHASQRWVGACFAGHVKPSGHRNVCRRHELCQSTRLPRRC